MSAGYSGTPLAKKLGIKEGSSIKLVNEPEHYFSLFTDLPKEINIKRKTAKELDLIHFFITSMKELHKELPILKNQIKKNGIIWISWPKKASKVPSDVTEDLIRNLAIKEGLVDVKVCAVDEVWSGLKLVFRLKDR